MTKKKKILIIVLIAVVAVCLGVAITCMVIFSGEKEYLETPTIVVTYNGHEQTARFEDTDLYIISSECELVGTNAGEYTGAVKATLKDTKNYAWKDSSSDTVDVIFVIKRADPTIELESVLTFATGTSVEAALSMVSVSGVNLEQIEISSENLSFIYYTDSNCQTLTNLANSGTQTEGGAPVLAGTYYVVATFAGNENYNMKSSDAAEFALDDESYGFYATGDETQFEWVGENGSVAFSKSSSAYGFDVLEISLSDGGTYVIYKQGGEYKFEDSEGIIYSVQIENSSSLKIYNGENITTYTKNVAESFVGTYTCTYSGEYGTETNILTIYREDGSYYFEFTFVCLDSDSGELSTDFVSGYIIASEAPEDEDYDKLIVLYQTNLASGATFPNIFCHYYSSENEYYQDVIIISNGITGIGNYEVGTYTRQ